SRPEDPGRAARPGAARRSVVTTTSTGGTRAPHPGARLSKPPEGHGMTVTWKSAVVGLLVSAAAVATAPSVGHAADPCSATATLDGILTIPVLTFAGSSYSAVLQITGGSITGGSGDLVQAQIVSAQSTTLSCANPAALVVDTTSPSTLILNIP